MKKILVVDDEAVNRSILSLIFQNEYDVLEAENGEVALRTIKKYGEDIIMILLDLHMPIMNGFEVLDALKASDYMLNIPVILITVDESYDSERVGYDYSVMDIIRKPFDSHIVSTRVKNVIELWQHKNHLEELVDEQTKQIKVQAQKLKEINMHIIDTLSTVVEFRNLETGQHTKRIRYFTKILLGSIREYYPEYHLNDELIELISNAAAMHDVGKIAIPDSILLKPGRLTSDEFEVMKTHTVRGCEIVDMISAIQEEEVFYSYCYEICRYHHERYDGKGYPDGLSGEEIPIAAQAVSIADVYDALVSERVYKAAYTEAEAVQMILNGECGVFSPKVLNCFQMVCKDFAKLVKDTK